MLQKNRMVCYTLQAQSSWKDKRTNGYFRLNVSKYKNLDMYVSSCS